MPNYGPNKIWDSNTSFERSLSKLSENHKHFEIGSSELKLWLLKDILFNQWKSFRRHNLEFRKLISIRYLSKIYIPAFSFCAVLMKVC